MRIDYMINKMVHDLTMAKIEMSLVNPKECREKI